MGKNSKTQVRQNANVAHDPNDPRTWQDDTPATYVVQPDEDTELDEVFADFPQNEACIELYRVNAQGGRPMFLEQLSPAMFSMAYVTERYGGGRYFAKGKYKDGSKKRMPFEVEGDPIPVKRRAYQVDPLAPVLPAGAAPPSVERIIETSGGDNAAILALVRTMITEMKNSETGILEKMRLYKELFAQPEKQSTPVEQAISMLKQGIELGAANQGGEGGFPWLMVLDKLKEPLTKLADTVHHAVTSRSVANVPVQPVQPSPPGQPAAPVPAPEATAPTPSEPVLAMVRGVLPMLITGAARNSDPQLYVDLLLDQLPGSAYTALRQWLQQPDCLDQLAHIEPGIRYQYDWWVNLRSLLVSALEEELAGDSGSVHTEPSSHAPTHSSAARPDLS